MTWYPQRFVTGWRWYLPGLYLEWEVHTWPQRERGLVGRNNGYRWVSLGRYTVIWKWK